MTKKLNSKFINSLQIKEVIKGLGHKGLLFDIHGQSHGQNSTELGYGISKELIDAAVSGADIDAVSTIDALSARSGEAVKTLLLGKNESLGALLQAQGFAGLPAPNNPLPGKTNYKYYRVSSSSLMKST